MATETKTTDCDYCGQIALCHEDGYGGKACKSCKPVPSWPENLQVALDAAIEAWDDDKDHPYHDPCVDNWRVARGSNAEEVAKYEHDEQHGCCGSYHQEIEVDGETLWVGFNYGH
jgi:hypothetical protein